jgi:hypothetical protein
LSREKGRDMNSARGKNTHKMCTAAAAIFFARFYTWKRRKEKNKKNLVGNVYKKRRRNSFTKDKVKPK